MCLVSTVSTQNSFHDELIRAVICSFKSCPVRNVHYKVFVIVSISTLIIMITATSVLTPLTLIMSLIGFCLDILHSIYDYLSSDVMSQHTRVFIIIFFKHLMDNKISNTLFGLVLSYYLQKFNIRRLSSLEYYCIGCYHLCITHQITTITSIC